MLQERIKQLELDDNLLEGITTNNIKIDDYNNLIKKNNDTIAKYMKKLEC